jgi:AcrR family transcriptional regulator
VVERAGGSKATVYSLFENKEGLFAALVAEAAEELSALVQSYHWTQDRRTTCATSATTTWRILTRPERLALFRLVLGECGRVPEVGEIFFRTGPQVIFRKVVDMLRSAAARGQIAVSDAEAMAHFFIDALRGHVHMEVLLNPTRRPTPKEIERHVDFVVEIFCAPAGPRRAAKLLARVRGWRYLPAPSRPFDFRRGSRICRQRSPASR